MTAMYIFRLFFIPWLVTIAVEETAAVIWKCRSARELLTVLIVNTVTNPAVTLVRLALNRNVPDPGIRKAAVIVIEVIVVLAEWLLFRKFMERKRNYFLFSIVLNGLSYGAGLLLPVI